jgi:hypothetical protein
LTRAKNGRILFLDVLSAVPPFPSHVREAKPAERRDRSQSTSVHACFRSLYVICSLLAHFVYILSYYKGLKKTGTYLNKLCIYCNDQGGGGGGGGGEALQLI